VRSSVEVVKNSKIQRFWVKFEVETRVNSSSNLTYHFPAYDCFFQLYVGTSDLGLGLKQERPFLANFGICNRTWKFENFQVFFKSIFFKERSNLEIPKTRNSQVKKSSPNICNFLTRCHVKSKLTKVNSPRNTVRTSVQASSSPPTRMWLLPRIYKKCLFQNFLSSNTFHDYGDEPLKKKFRET
jgi:hypothetical protein